MFSLATAALAYNHLNNSGAQSATCPMKRENKDKSGAQQMDMSKVVVVGGDTDSCCQPGADCCKGGACCRKKK